MGVFSFLDTFVKELFHRKVKLGAMNKDKLFEICKYQKSYLKDFNEILDNFPVEALNNLRDKYLAQKNRNEKYPIQGIIKDLQRDTVGKAQASERSVLFGSSKKTISTFLKIISEIEKNYNTLYSDKYILLDQARITDVLLFGILKEMDLFTKYFGYLWEYFTIVLDNEKSPPGYRQEYLASNYDKFVTILNNVGNKENNYSFLNDINRIKRNNADLVLNTGFLPFVNTKNYSSSDEKHLMSGILGFNMLSAILEFWDMWKHSSIMKSKKHKEWMQNQQARLLQIYQDVDPNSKEAEMYRNYIKAYSDEIASLDKKILAYEEGK